jgi:hypothetical protein
MRCPEKPETVVISSGQKNLTYCACTRRERGRDVLNQLASLVYTQTNAAFAEVQKKLIECRRIW